MYSHLPDDDSFFSQVLVDRLKPRDPIPGTDYPRMLEVVTDATDAAPEKEIHILIVGDGLNDYAGNPDFAKRYRAAAARLARNSCITCVHFWGVGAGPREEIRDVCKPLGRRLQIQSLEQNPLAP